MNKEHSERWIKTEEKMENTAIALMQKADINHITVRDICEAANVNRTTFYTHFLDINDLYDKLERRMSAGIMARYTKRNNLILSKESLIPFLTHIKENQAFYRIVLDARNSFPIKEGYDHLIEDIVKPICIYHGIVDKEKMNYYLVFFQAGFTMCLRRWVDHDCRESKEEIASLLANCFPLIF